MAHPIRFFRILPLVAVLLALSALGPAQVETFAMGVERDLPLSGINTPFDTSRLMNSPISAQSPTAVNCTATTCPSSDDAALDKCVERTKFCVYYTTDSISETQADWAADVVQDYWDRFVALSFLQPKYSSKLEVYLSDIPGDCNGGSSWDSNAISTYAGCFDVDLFAQKVLGHELTHRVQYAYDTGPGAPIQTKFEKEGTARATEDNWFSEIDHWAAALSHSSFNTEANNYLLATANDITSYDMRYKSALWWKYAMEQYGVTLTEPQRGIDFVRQVYSKNTSGFSGVAAVNQALSAMGTGTNFDGSFRRFGAAIYTKDLSSLPNNSYNFIDEEEAGNPAVYGPLAPTSGGTIQIGTSASWNNVAVNPYALRYYSATIGTPCPIVTASFHKDDAGPAFYHIITQDGSVFKHHKEGSGADWSQSFVTKNITKITAVAGSLGSSAQVDVSLSCANPVLDIKLPNSVAFARVQTGSKFLAQVLVTNGSGGPVVAGLTNSHFLAEVNGVSAPVTGGGFIQEQYWLVIEAPSLSDGTYNLAVTLQDPDSGSDLATDTSASSVFYTTELTDQAIVIDRSGSMGVGTPTRLSAAKDAASFYVDVTRDGDGLAVVPYNYDANPAPFAMTAVTPAVRNSAKTFINALTASSSTSIGDGLYEGLNQIKSSETGNTNCSFVLLSDGMENTPKWWADVRTDIIDSHCPVTSIAFGPESDETLMQTIASDTGGTFFYNDVFVSAAANAPEAIAADMSLDLGNTYEFAEGKAEGRQRLLAEKGVINEKIYETKHFVYLDELVSEAVFSLDWYETYFAELEFILVDPKGKEYNSRDPGYSFKNLVNNHVGFRVPKPEPGQWSLFVRYINSEEADVPYQVIVSGKSKITLDLLLPDRLGLKFETGNRVPIYALLSAMDPIPDALVLAFVTAPNGGVTQAPLFDDGEHGDGSVRDGLYAGVYTAVNQAEAVKPTGEEDQSVPLDQGAYRVLVRATHEKFQREAMGAFAVLEAPDADKDRLPDTWEKENNVSSADGDPDLDLLNNYQEYAHGTNPHDPDSDDGGEKDGSEVNRGSDPLEPSDDLIRRPDFLQVRPWMKAVVLTYDFKPDYDFMRLFRSNSLAGPWSEIPLNLGLPATGIYTDTNVTNGLTYFYRTEGVIVPTNRAVDTATENPQIVEIVSAVLTSEGVTPTADPILPEALVVIDDGAALTHSLNVTLDFYPYESEGPDALAAFEDITAVMISNQPDFAGAVWQPFTQGIPWVLQAGYGQVAHVYVKFKDKADNLSLSPETDTILYDFYPVYLPTIRK